MSGFLKAGNPESLLVSPQGGALAPAFVALFDALAQILKNPETLQAVEINREKARLPEYRLERSDMFLRQKILPFELVLLFLEGIKEKKDPVAALRLAQFFFLLPLQRHFWVSQPPGSWQQPFSSCFEDVLKAAKSLELIGEVLPARKSYACTLILGSTLQSMASRLTFLKQLVEKGLEPGRVIFLTGDRHLTEDEKKELPQGFSQEADAARFLLEQGKEWFQAKGLEFFVLNAPKKPEALRATTEDAARNFITWEGQPREGEVLLISSQPFVNRQWLNFLAVAKDCVLKFDAAGPEEERLGTILKEIEGKAEAKSPDIEARKALFVSIILEVLAQSLYSAAEVFGFDGLSPADTP